jgi:hypothetical protein
MEYQMFEKGTVNVILPSEELLVLLTSSTGGLEHIVFLEGKKLGVAQSTLWR